ncbi:hypothetical protein BGY98DRAFT_85399 [Russula aff. rugulosa BPL654]|nr:hypothetical protein BGY98DRAFT_85399 [Russula aff. rugulosa BPL654]
MGNGAPGLAAITALNATKMMGISVEKTMRAFLEFCYIVWHDLKNGPGRYDTIFVNADSSADGMRGI